MFFFSLPGEQVPSTELLADKAVYTSSDRIVTLTSTGLLQSYGVLGHALLIITSIDKNGLKQRLNIVVEVLLNTTTRNTKGFTKQIVG